MSKRTLKNDLKRFLWMIIWLGLSAVQGLLQANPAEETLSFGRFGTVSIYRATTHPSRVILFVSGDGGWNLGVVEMAKSLSEMDALVVGVDITRYLRQLGQTRETCLYPAADFEALSQFVQQQLNFPAYIYPALIGYSSGATLVYATLVQAPPTTFQGGISMGFCPDLLVGKPLCRGSGLSATPGPKGQGTIFQPATSLEVPWVVLQGSIDQVCDSAQTEVFVKQVKAGQLISLPKVGHGFSVQRNWMPQLRQAFGRMVKVRKESGRPETPAIQDLPLVEVPAQPVESDSMGIILTGDGGWGVTDRGIAESLAAQGVPVVGLNSLQYFWKRHTPETSAADLQRIILHYQSTWNKNRLILIGYSFGAEVLPFLVNRLPAETRARISVLGLLGPGPKADFEFHLTDWLGSFNHDSSQPVIPELIRLKGLRMLCFYGAEDTDTICDDLDHDLVKAVPISGGHRLGRNYAAIAKAILDAAK